MTVTRAAGCPADPAAFSDVEGVVVGGGLTPAYWEGLHPARAAICRTVAEGTPYLGFSAGAMGAPRRALVGGYRINGVEGCREECSEGLDGVDTRARARGGSRSRWMSTPPMPGR
ncbi:hypothetical protein NG819_06240 [Pseudarthrobacter sp. Fe7]|nr:hypothetical protein NG819_06240 [Pseudarthrobacter sp. Fe7]